MTETKTPTVFTIPPGVCFVDALAHGILANATDEPAALTDITVLLPTRRACRSLREAFLRARAGRPLLLPRMLPLGDVDEEELAFADWRDTPVGAAGSGDIPPAIPGLRRQLLLARQIRALDPGATSPDQAVRLATELARLLDQMHTQGLSFERLRDLVPEHLAAHWQVTLEFLDILTANWPAVLAEEGGIDGALRRNLLIEAEARAWRRQPPATPVIAAGSTGSIPATADLLKVVARLPAGSVVLPGLDREADGETWQALQPSHPQYGMARLLEHLGVGRDQVGTWPAGPDATPPARAALVNRALRPAATFDRGCREAPPAADALDGVSFIDCPTPAEEAGAIALVMRGVLEEDARTAALITPDRALARRAAAELRRWGVDIDDSAGQPLARTPPGAFLRLTARMAAEDMAPVPLLAVLKHPLAAAGGTTAALRRRVRDLEKAVLRGPRPQPGIAGLRAALAAKDKAVEFVGLLDALERITRPFCVLLSGAEAPFGELLSAHVRMAEDLATSDAEAGPERLWRGEAGEGMAALLAELGEAGDIPGNVAPASYPALFDSLMAGAVVRPRYGRHPRLAIWGLLEARLQRADVLVLGGLNEGTWPAEAGASPWMSRPMQEKLGLPLPERRIGLAAHDFTQAFSAPRVVLTRAARVGGTPTVPSRWLLRLQNAIRGTAVEAALQPDRRWLEWFSRLDAPDAVQPVPPPAPTPPLAARPRELSVTRIETWIRDPYAIYARHILGLRVLDPIDADPAAAERGIIIHDALDRFVHDFPRDLPDDALERLMGIGEEVFREKLAWPGVRAFWWPRFRRIAGWFVDYERQRRSAGYRTVAAEATGRIVLSAGDRTFVLTARADRIDRHQEGGFSIIDYKTGQPPTAPQVKCGLVPQLSLEAAMVAAGGFAGLPDDAVERLVYVHLSGGRVAGEEKVLKLDAAEVAAEALQGLQRRVEAFFVEETPYRSRPCPMFASRFADYDHLARVKEWATDVEDSP